MNVYDASASPVNRNSASVTPPVVTVTLVGTLWISSTSVVVAPERRYRPYCVALAPTSVKRRK